MKLDYHTMALNAADQQELKTYINSVVKYRETYDEIYDHILTALTLQNDNLPFYERINAIVGEDFGGYENLRLMEIRSANAVAREMNRNYKNYFAAWLKFPDIIYTTGFLWMLFYITLHYVFAAEAIYILMIIMPFILLWSRGFKNGFIFGSNKTSVRDGVFQRLACRPFFYSAISYYPYLLIKFLLTKFISMPAGFGLNKTGGAAFITIMITALALHSLSCYKLLKDEFKMALLN